VDRALRRSFVLITPAHNEARYIGATILSIVSQVVRPQCWVIVNDGSTDGTRDIVERAAKEHDFIRVINRPVHRGRNTGAKVKAIRAGLAKLRGLQYRYVGNLDADVTMEPAYYRDILERMESDERLGLCGGKIWEMCNGRFRLFRTANDSVAGAVQLFRRECFEEIGGYAELRDGFEDAAAEITARTIGWKTRSYEDLVVRHHRRIGLTGRSIWEAKVTAGMNEYRVGYHYFFHLARTVLTAAERPIMLGSLLVAGGYLGAFFRGMDKIVGSNIVGSLRKEQMGKLARLFSLKRMV
jgi:poly-beta-1,6-N-acetyl-D-glucosamine synthase